MLKNSKRIISLLLTLVMLITSVPMMASAATSLSLFDGALSITDNNGSGSASGTTVTITTKGGYLSATTNTITIKNSGTETKKLSFSFSVSGADSHSFGSNSGSVDTIMAPNDTLTYTVTAPKYRKTATLTLSNMTFEAVGSSGSITINYDSALGSVTLNGTAVTSGATVDSLSASEASTLVATANSGAKFLGWLNTSTNSFASTATTYSCIAGNNTTFEAVFTNQNSKPYWQVGGYVFGDLNKAITAAGSSGTIILLNDATLPAGNYTIPSGVTLAIPFNDAHTIYTGEPETTNVTDGDKNPYINPTLYRTLRMASGANIVVNGIMTIPAKLFAANGARRGAGSPIESYSMIDMAQGSSITVNNGAKLFSYGYIIGDGTVTIKSGGEVYECFQLMDFYGGNATTALTDSGKGVFPFSSYYVQNIEVLMTIEAGAAEYAYTAITMSSMTFCEAVDFIGTSSSSAMFKLNSGYVTKEYDPATDRMILTSYGDLSISPIEVSIGNILAKVDINSAEYELPINQNISIVLESGSTSTVNQDMAMLPGSELHIKEGATCTLGTGNNIYLYDLDQWGGYLSPSNLKVLPCSFVPDRTHTFAQSDLKDAMLVVDGTVNALGGYAYSTPGGASVTGNGIIKTTPGTQTETYRFVYNGTASEYGTYSSIPLVPAMLKNSNNTFLNTSAGGANAYTTNDKGMWECLYIEGETPGHNWTQGTTTSATCTTNGSTNHNCSICTATKSEVIPATGHNYASIVTPATCTTEGYTTYTCSGCNNSYVDNKIAATGHNYESEVVAPTANSKGYTKHTCSACGDSYTDNETGFASDDSALTAAIASANSLVAEDYSTESFNALASVCDDSASVKAGANSQSDIDNATSEILSAISALEPYLNLSVKAKNGTASVAYGDTTGGAGKYAMLFGTQITLTATANDGYVFEGWYETTTKRIFSTDATYTFVITSNTDFEAKFVKENGATLTFTNKSGQIVKIIDKTVTEWSAITTIASLLPDVPYSYGFTNGRWVYDDATVIASLQAGTDVTIKPEYDATDIENPVIPTPNGDEPVLDLYYSYNTDASKGTFLMATGIPEGCVIESIGVAFYYKTADEFDPTSFTLTLNNKMLTSKFTDINEDNTYIVNVGQSFLAKYNWAAKGYVTYYDADGNLKTAYTNQINLNGIEKTN